MIPIIAVHLVILILNQIMSNTIEFFLEDYWSVRIMKASIQNTFELVAVHKNGCYKEFDQLSGNKIVKMTIRDVYGKKKITLQSAPIPSSHSQSKIIGSYQGGGFFVSIERNWFNSNVSGVVGVEDVRPAAENDLHFWRADGPEEGGYELYFETYLDQTNQKLKFHYPPQIESSLQHFLNGSKPVYISKLTACT